eukprot:9485084-Pyramimonas_sp.AAC.1
MRHNPSSEGDIDLSEEPQRKVNKHYKSKKEGGTWSMTQNIISESMDFREKHGLPEYGSDKMSSITPRRGILPDRERDIIDVIGLMHEKAGGDPRGPDDRRQPVAQEEAVQRQWENPPAGQRRA